MSTGSGWIEQRRGDGELVGWIRPHGDGFVPIDLLGRELTAACEWFEAESLLDDSGIGYLADAYELRLEDGTWVRVRITEVTTSHVTVKNEDWGAIEMPLVVHALPFPVGDELRIHRSAGRSASAPG